MRLASFLPMLLLLVSPLTAQQNCQIFDLTASVVQFNQATCQFFVVLDFEHLGTSNQFTVKGNGNNYGLFPYGQLPITLGPFAANPNGPTQLEFQVQDAVFQDCSGAVQITVPACVGTGVCDINNLSIQVGDCNPGSLTYFVKIDFDVAGAAGDLFEVSTIGGVSLGIFPVAALPVVVSNFPWSGGVFDAVKVCMVDQPNCCEAAEFLAPDCLQGCGIVGLQVSTGDCLTDSTYKAIVNFELIPLFSTQDSFKLFVNDAPAGTYHINQLPLPIEVTTNGGPNDVVRVCVTDVQGVECCREKSFDVPACLAPCAIQNLKIETDTCSSDSTFGLWVNFNVVDSTAVDSFALWGNGQPLGHFGMDQLPLYLPNFQWNGLIFNTIRVCTGNASTCCKELQFLAPDCLPFDSSCEVTNLFVETGTCSSDSTYKLFLNFNATNPGNGTFIVYANGVVLDTFDLTEAPLFIQHFPWSGGPLDEVTVCIGSNSSVPGTSPNLCCKTREFHVPDCLLPCDIHDLIVEIVGDCDPATNTYPVKINFHAIHPGNDLFDVYVNGNLEGTFPLNQLPLVIQVPADSSPIDIIKVCINDQPNCCAATEVQAPDCDDDDCAIVDLHVEVGDCNPLGGYHLTLNFDVQNPGNDFFEVWAGNQYLGLFPLNQLPLHIPSFPASGNPFDVIKVCINDHPDCCKTIEFQAPNCGGPCEIVDIQVETGDCNADSTYHLTLDFEVLNASNLTQFAVFANNNQPLGIFNLSQLPLHIPNFPWDGQGPTDKIKICLLDLNIPPILLCCTLFEFPSPDCFTGGNCDIFDLEVQTGDCNPAGGYQLTLNFQVQHPASDSFELWGNNQYLGIFALNQLPLQIPNFPGSGNAGDFIKVCILDQPDCCAILQFLAPHCDPCEIFNLTVQTGDCNPDSTYQVWLNFQVVNSTATQFVVWGNGQQIGIFNLNQLPLLIPNFPWDGQGPNDLIKVCIGGNTGAFTCCKTLEFPSPACLPGGDCEINNLHVETGQCTSDSTYVLVFDFDVSNPPGNVFGVWANGQFLGMYGLNQLPVTIQNFPWNGGQHDVLKVCFGNNSSGATCCDQIEFDVPDCLTDPGDCQIVDLSVITGDCTSDSTYVIKVDFEVLGANSAVFGLWGNGQFIGTYNLNQLPVVVQNFHWNGGAFDVIKVCMLNPNGVELCCKAIEFQVPDCLDDDNCEITGMVVDPGDCTSDSTYSLFLNFQVSNPPGNMFGVWGNGQFLGNFSLNQLPLNFPNFPWNGGQFDAVKVCFVNSGALGCCKTVEFEVPDCLGDDPCHIYDLVGVRTACLCGQFFVAITFEHENGSSAGFNIFGNGQQYGNFPYHTQQPIILGPFPGDGTTPYEFVVQDAEHPDCHDAIEIGIVECQTPVVEPGSGSSLVISPNPASNWVNIAASLGSGAEIGQATVKLYHADGRLLQTLTIANAANFQLDVSQFPAGVYRVSILASNGRVEGSFTKQ